MQKLSYVLTLAVSSAFITGCLDSSSSIGILSSDDVSGSSSGYKTSVFIQSEAAPGGSNGFAFDDKDLMYLTSIYARSIYVIDTTKGKIQKVFTIEDGIEGPDDIAMDADNNMYWTSFFTGNIGKTTPKGETTLQFVNLFVNPIAFSADGRLFTALDFFGSGIYELDPNFIEAPKLVGPDIKLNGMSFGPDGLLYAPSPEASQIVSVDVDNSIVNVLMENMSVPATVKFNSKGEAYSATEGDGRIFRMNLNTDPVTTETLTYLERGIDNMGFDSTDRLFVSNSHNGSIIEILPDNSTREILPPGFVTPSGIAVKTNDDGSKAVYLADVFALIEFDAATGKEISHARDDLMPGGLEGPSTVSVDGDNFILTSVIFPNIQVWDHVKKEPISEYTGYVGAVNAIRFQSDIVVAELGTGFKEPRLILMDDADTKRQTIADASHGLVTPAGLVARGGNLWVSDRATGKILQVASDGIPLSTPITVATGLDKPEGLAMDSANRILVVESGKGQLSRLDLATGQLDVLASKLGLGREGLAALAPTFMFNGVAVDDEDVIYVTAEIDNAIYRIEPKK